MTKIKCPYIECAHGMDAVAKEGKSCYAGDPQNPECPGFITEEEWEESKWKRK
jgi:hypothetical protein